MRTAIYYYNDAAMMDQVRNLTAILGRNEMIRRTGGNKRTMEFWEQKSV